MNIFSEKTSKLAAVGFVLTAFSQFTAWAQGTQAKMEITLDKAIEIALAENPTMKVAEKDIQLKVVADKEAWQALLPTLDGSLALSHNIKVAEMRTSMGTFKMGMDGSTTAQGGVTLTLPLFAPAAYQNMKLTKEDILVAQEKARGSKLDLVNQVKKAYYGALLAEESLAVIEKAYNTSKEYFEVIDNSFKVGRVSEYDKLSAEVQTRNMSSSVVQAKTGVKLAKLQLKVLMGVTADVDLVINDNLKDYESEMLIPREVPTDELASNTNLRQIDLNMTLLERARKIMKTNFMPTIAMQMTGQYQSMSNPNWNFFKYHYSPSLSLAFAVSVPIFKMSNWTKLESNRIQMSSLLDTRENVRHQLSLAAASYRENMVSTVAQLESNREAVAQADKAVNISAKRYEVGKGTVLELNQSETALTQAELTYAQSIYTYLTNRADLEYTLGKE